MSGPPAALLAPELRAFVAELEGLLRVITRRGDLVVDVGEPGGPWLIQLAGGRVRCDPDHLRTRSRDFCRGLALHEAAHACLTLYHQIVPPSLLSAPGLPALLNVVEDCRIETWLQRRLPGCVAWIREYNDALFGSLRAADPQAPASAQFLCGLLARWWYGAPPTGMKPDAARALAAATPALLRSADLHPPPIAPPGAIVSASYARHPVARVFLALDAREPPTDDQRLARMTQYATWELIYRDILPHYQRLLDAEPPRPDQPPAAVTRALERLAEDHIGDPDAARRGGAAGPPAPVGQPPEAAGGAAGEATIASAQRAVERALQNDPRDRYLQAWRRLHGPVDRLARDVLEVFEKRNRSRITRGHPTGRRVTLRAAMQLEAQPAHHRRLWERLSRPERVDPLLILVIDRSGSMSGANMAHTFQGIVLLSEVAARVGLPLELFTFNDTAQHDLRWDEGVGEGTRARLGALPDRCGGGTDLANALRKVRARVGVLPFRDVYLVVLSDGETDDVAAAQAELRTLAALGVRSVGLGIGAGARALSVLFPGDPVGVGVEEVPERFIGVLRGFLGR